MIENKDFEPFDTYDGDIIRINRLQEFVDSSFEIRLPQSHWL